MNRGSRRLRALGGLALIPALLAVVPATAAPPPAPGYVCGSSASAPAANATKIMIAGDSITNASAGDYTWPYWLWRNQIDAGKNIDFVGRFKDTINANTLVLGSRAYLDCDFDQDDEARPGVKLWTDQVNLGGGTYALGQKAPTNSDVRVPSYGAASSWIRGATQQYEPDVLILFAGSNDLLRTSQEFMPDRSEEGIATFVIDKLAHVIDEARLANDQIDIILTTVPDGPATSRYTRYNDKLPALVAAKNTAGSRVVLADMPTWTGNSWDGLHPDATGEVDIAAAFADSLHALDADAFAARPNPLPTPAIGPRFPATLNAATNGNNRVKLTWTLPPGADRTIVFARNVNGGAWLRKADLVLPSLRKYKSTIGTATCPNAGTTQVPCTSYTVTGLNGGTTYEFKVQLAKGAAVAPEAAVPPVVKQVQAIGPVLQPKLEAPVLTSAVHAIRLDWLASSGATVYDVRWRVAGTSAYRSTTSTATTRTVTGLLAGRGYAFAVRARNAGSTGAWSDERQAVPRANTLGVGRKPVLTKVKGTKIKAVWSASAGANRYQLQRRVAGGAWKVVATTSKRSVVSGKLKKGKTYQFRVRPFDSDVGGKFSAVAKRKAR